MKITAFVTICVSMVFAMASCESENAMSVINQEAEIETFIQNKCADYEVFHNGGASRVVLVPGSPSVTVASGDSVTVMLEGFVFKNGPSTQFLSDSTSIRVGGRDVVEGLGNGLIGAGLGEESYIIFSAKYGYYKSSVGVVPPMSALIFHTLVTAIKKN